jgi:hypothetical protein
LPQRNEKKSGLEGHLSIIMSLKNITLAKETITQLYTAPLVSLQTAEDIHVTKEDKSSIKYLGSNQKNITILVNIDDAPFINDKSFQFLTGILNACALTVADVALINMRTYANTGYADINKTTAPATTLLFDINQADIGLPLQFPHFQVQRYGNVAYLSAPSLAVIEADKSLKSSLWGGLKKMFQL